MDYYSGVDSNDRKLQISLSVVRVCTPRNCVFCCDDDRLVALDLTVVAVLAYFDTIPCLL